MSDDSIKLRAMIDNFIIDCLLSDSHSFDSDVTEFPVESGATISDNIRPKPLVVAMEGIISNTPLTEVARFRKVGAIPSESAYAMLLSIRKDRRLVSISTSLATYENMALETLSIPRASGRGDELRFSASFKQVEIVANKRTTRVAVPSAQGPSAANLALIPETSDEYRWMDYGTHSWYDPHITAWRYDATFQSDIHKSYPLKFVLYKGRPEELTPAQWLPLRNSFASDAQVRAVMMRKHGNQELPALFKRPAAGILTLAPYRFQIIGFTGQVKH